MGVEYHHHKSNSAVEEFELPLINLSHLLSPHEMERDKCVTEIVCAARDWGFFQVVNHGISEEVFNNMNYEQKKVFHQPFEKKVQKNFQNLSPDSYRWGNPKATCLKQLSWSEAFHISMADLSGMNECKILRFDNQFSNLFCKKEFLVSYKISLYFLIFFVFLIKFFFLN